MVEQKLPKLTTRVRFPSPAPEKILNMALRLGTLAAKMVLTLYMGRYFLLSDMGSYGLASGIVLILCVALGLRLDYMVSREIVDVAPKTALSKMRDQAVFYSLNHAALAAAMLVLWASGATGMETEILAYVFVLSVAENFASLIYANMNSLGQPLAANALFFVRAGLWVVPVAALGLWHENFRDVDTVLLCWTMGTVSSILATGWVWRKMPWREAMAVPVDWAWMKSAIVNSFPVWLGTMGMAGGIYVDRFVVSTYLGLEEAGVVTFYFSFVNALVTLIQSGVLAFAYPRLIVLHRNGDKEGFKREAWTAARHVAFLGLFIAGLLGAGVWGLSRFMNHPEFIAGIWTFWLMLLGAWVRSNADTLHYILFARHQDKAIWLGNILFLIPAFGGNLVLVPMFGLIGVGYGSALSAICLFLWRLWFVWKHQKGDK